MDRVLTDDVWSQISKELKSAKRRMAAVAYVTSQRYLKLVRNDVLVCDASDIAIKSGQTSARLLQSLLRRGVEVWSKPGLHSKVSVFGKYALIGSSNLSASSEDNLTELSLLTDRGQVVSQVSAFVHGLREVSDRVDREFVHRILAIPVIVVDRGSRRGTNATRLRADAYRILRQTIT